MSREDGAASGGRQDGIIACIARNRGAVALLLATQAGLRLAAIGVAVAFGLLRGGGIPENGIPWWICLPIGIVLWMLLVLPGRCHGGEALRRMFYSRGHSGDRKSPYKIWLQTEIVRHARGFLWGLPFFAAVGLTAYSGYQLYKGKYVSARWQRVQDLAAWVGKEPSLGTGLAVALSIAGIVLLLTGLLFAYGWWRDMPVEYLPSRSIGVKKTYSWSRHMRRHHRKECASTTLVNLLLTLPAFAGAAAVAYRYCQLLSGYLRQHLSGDGSAGALQVRAALSQLPPPSRNQLLALAAVFLVLYLPLCLVRKTRNARLVAHLMRRSTEYQHHRPEEAEAAKEPENHAAG